MCLGNNQGNFQLHRFTTNENIANSLGDYFFDCHCRYLGDRQKREYGQRAEWRIKSSHITPTVKSLHWFKIKKVSSLKANNPSFRHLWNHLPKKLSLINVLMNPHHCHLISHPPVYHHFHQPSLTLSSTPGSKLIFSINFSLHSFYRAAWNATRS